MADSDPQTAGPIPVLIVEDEFLFFLDAEEALHAHGYRVVGPAASVARALDLLDQERPDVVLLDVNLNGEWSTPVAGVLREVGIPFLLTSSSSESVLGPSGLLEGRYLGRARADVLDPIARFYNPRRRHARLACLSPMEVEARAMLAYPLFTEPAQASGASRISRSDWLSLVSATGQPVSEQDIRNRAQRDEIFTIRGSKAIRKTRQQSKDSSRAAGSQRSKVTAVHMG